MTDFSKGAAYVGGIMVPVAEAKISLLDWGFLHSDATYDVAGVLQGKFFRLDDHIERFFASMEKLHMSIPHSRSDLRDILIDCVRSSGLRDAYVEMICTRGLPRRVRATRAPARINSSLSPYRLSGSQPLKNKKRGCTLSSAAGSASHRNRSIPP